jgi:hypothetical protein
MASLDGSRVLSYLVSTTDYESLASYPKKQARDTYNGVLTPSQILGTRQRSRTRPFVPPIFICMAMVMRRGTDKADA